MTTEFKSQKRKSKGDWKPFEHDPNRIKFHDVYMSFGTKQRAKLKETFCKVHGLASPSFNARVSGANRVREKELQWLESFDPYKDPANA